MIQSNVSCFQKKIIWTYKTQFNWSESIKRFGFQPNVEHVGEKFILSKLNFFKYHNFWNLIVEIAFLQRILYLTKRSHTNDLSYIVFQRKMLMSEIDFFKIMTTVKFYKVYFIYSILSIHTRLNSLDLLHSSKYITEHEHVYVCHRQTARCVYL